MKLRVKDFLNVQDLSKDEILYCFELTKQVKADRFKKEYNDLKGQTWGMIFNKPSTRTRVSFEVGIRELGGSVIYLSMNDLQIGKGETLYDTAKTLSRYLKGLVIRTYSDQEVHDLGKYSSFPVINALTDLHHPCQSMTDLFTVYENNKKLDKNLKFTFIGDCNNVSNSLIINSSKLGIHFVIAVPKGYEFNKDILEQVEANNKVSGGSYEILNNPDSAAKDSDVLYTDVWISMGFEKEKEERLKAFEGFQINSQLLSKAKKDCIVMHCLPAKRELEITSEVMDGKQSVVFDQAENRLHTQKAIMIMLNK